MSNSQNSVVDWCVNISQRALLQLTGSDLFLAVRRSPGVLSLCLLAIATSRLTTSPDATDWTTQG